MPIPAEASSYDDYNSYNLNRQSPVFTPDRFQRLNNLFEELPTARGKKRFDGLNRPHFDEACLLAFLVPNKVEGGIHAFRHHTLV